VAKGPTQMVSHGQVKSWAYRSAVSVLQLSYEGYSNNWVTEALRIASHGHKFLSACYLRYTSSNASITRALSSTDSCCINAVLLE
jgi:hypothetical protein